jgi:iron complex transport system substrate-binding protein
MIARALSWSAKASAERRPRSPKGSRSDCAVLKTAIKACATGIGGGARRRRTVSASVVLIALLVVAAAPLLRAAVPARIVSTSPSITETLFALGLGDRVVGVSTFCRYPDAVKSLPKVGTFLKPDAEVIARLRPDLVIVHLGPHDVARQLGALSIKTATVDRGTLPGVYSTIRTIAAAAGVVDRGEKLVDELQQRLTRVRQAVSARPPRKVLVIVGRRPGALSDLVAVGRESYLSDLVAIAGGANVVGGGGLPEYPKISMETVIRLAPDVIVDAGDMGDTPDTRQKRNEATLRLWSTQTAVAAVPQQGVHTVMSDAFVVPGPRVVEVAETLAAWIHGVSSK